MCECVVSLALTINTYTHSMHTQIFHPLSSINTSSVRVTQQINHHGYSNIIIAVLKVHSDWWCLWDHLNVSNEKSNNLHSFNDIISDWRLTDLPGKMRRVPSISVTPPALFLILQSANISLKYTVIMFLLLLVLESLDFHHLNFKWQAPVLLPTMTIKLQIKFWLIYMNDLWRQNVNPSGISRSQA